MKRENLKRFYKSSPITTMFLVIMVGYFMLISLNGGTNDVETLVRFGALFPPFISMYGEYYRLITSIFIHIGIMHLIFNGYALYIFGPQIEGLMGSKKYLIFFLLSGLGGNLATYFFSFDTVSAGASGSLFGVFGVFLYLIQHHKNMITPEGRKSIISLLLVNLVFTVMIPNISITAHLGGFIIGYLISYVLIK